jgi:hypothetical protein
MRPGPGRLSLAGAGQVLASATCFSGPCKVWDWSQIPPAESSFLAAARASSGRVRRFQGITESFLRLRSEFRWVVNGVIPVLGIADR